MFSGGDQKLCTEVENFISISLFVFERSQNDTIVRKNSSSKNMKVFMKLDKINAV